MYVCMYVKVYLKSLFKSVNTSVRLFKFTKKKSEITKSKISKYEKFKCLLVHCSFDPMKKSFDEWCRVYVRGGEVANLFLALLGSTALPAQ